MTPQSCFPFFVGRGRSGTTLLRVMFDSHPEMSIPEESHFILRLGATRSRYERPDGFAVDTFVHDLLRNWAFRRWDLSPDDVVAAYRASSPQGFAEAIRCAYEVFARAHGKTRYGDKTPRYVMSIPMLAELFPEARFVHLIRDGRDVALSHLSKGMGSRTLAGQAWWWRRYVRQGRVEGRRLGPHRYVELRYEDLVDDPERHVTALCSFLELDFRPEMLTYFERADGWMRDAADQRRHPGLYLPPTKGMRDWRRDMARHDVALFEAIAGTTLADFGYERAYPSLPLSARIDARRRVLGTYLERASGRFERLQRTVRSRRQVRPSDPLAEALDR